MSTRTLETWQSPRKLAEDERNYKRKRFEDYMTMADRGELTEELGIAALRNEIAFSQEIDNE